MSGEADGPVRGVARRLLAAHGAAWVRRLRTQPGGAGGSSEVAEVRTARRDGDGVLEAVAAELARSGRGEGRSCRMTALIAGSPGGISPSAVARAGGSGSRASPVGPDEWRPEAGAATLVIVDLEASLEVAGSDLAAWAAAGADLAIRFPVEGVRYLARFGGLPLADLPPYARRRLESLTRLLGGCPAWAFEWAERMRAGREAEAEEGVVRGLGARLAGGGTWTAVREVRARGVAGSEYLLLASRDPARLLAFNEVISRFRTEGRADGPDPAPGGVRFDPPVELDLFGRCDPVGEFRRTLDVPGLAHRLAAARAGGVARLDELLGELVETDLLEEEVVRALTALRADGRARFASLTAPDAVIEFPAGQRRVDARGRRRAVRSGAAPGLNLFTA